MKRVLLLLVFVTLGQLLLAQESNYNLKDGFVAKGYDVVSYFDGAAEKGKKSIVHEHEGLKFRFVDDKNLETFKSDPDKYIPQYGGWCAYAMAKDGSKVSINPKTYEIRDGKLYLFYNSWGTNTLKRWLKGDPEEQVKKGDEFWSRVE